MPPGLTHIISFVVGGLIFRYFEKIVAAIPKVREALWRAQDQIQKAQKEVGKSMDEVHKNSGVKFNFPKSQRSYY